MKPEQRENEFKIPIGIMSAYLGHKVFVPETNKVGRFACIDNYPGITTNISVYYSDDMDDFDVFNDYHDGVSRVKLILRPLSSITVDELKECNIEMGQILLAQFPKEAGLKFFAPKQFLWLLSHGFDIFDLHSSGACLFEEELKK